MSLTSAHWGAAAFHLAQSIFGFTWLSTEKKDQGFWTLTNNLGITRNPDAAQRAFGKSFKLAYLVPVFSALSAVNHVWSATDTQGYQKVLLSGANPVRWAEYSVSAGLMTTVISVLSGVDDIKTILALALANGAMQFTGYNVEKDTSLGRRDSANRQNAQGFIVFAAIWAAIFMGFFTNVSESEEDIGAQVYAIVIGLFLLFLCFGVLSTMYSTGRIKSFRKVEMGYIVLSLVAKTLLTNLTLFGSVFSADPN
jgi:hypothetical protein